MKDQYLDFLRRRIDAIVPGASDRLGEVDRLPGDLGLAILGEIIATGCTAQNGRNITAGRELASQLPRKWLETAVAEVAATTLDLEDEWEYRRLLELLQHVGLNAFNDFIRRGLVSQNPEVQEAAIDMQSVDLSGQGEVNDGLER